MTERPILMSAPMVRAILDGTKTQTRWIVKRQLPYCAKHPGGGWMFTDADLGAEVSRYAVGKHGMLCPYGQSGDRNFTAFRDAAPPANGWYWVRWTADDAERLVWLSRVPDEPQDDPPETEAHRWVWGNSPDDDPESIALEIIDPMGILWRWAGTLLWVRETWAPVDYLVGSELEDPVCVAFGADQTAWSYAGTPANKPRRLDTYGWPWDRVKWKPSNHMPRWASRITLEVVGVRVERVQDISQADILAEGVRVTCNAAGRPCIRVTGKHPPVAFLRDWETATLEDILRAEWASLWSETYGRDSWDANPWVWVVEFRRLP